MAENPTTEGPVKSLRQAAPAGDIIAGVFALIALLIAVGLVRNPASGLSVLLSVLFLLLFAVPAYVLYASSRTTGLFVTEERVEYRLMGRPQQGWRRDEVGGIEPMGGGLKLLAPDGKLLRRFKFRWWSTEQVALFARAAGLTPSAVESPLSEAMAQAAAEAKAEREAAASAADVDPGKAGDT